MCKLISGKTVRLVSKIHLLAANTWQSVQSCQWVSLLICVHFVICLYYTKRDKTCQTNKKCLVILTDTNLAKNKISLEHKCTCTGILILSFRNHISISLCSFEFIWLISWFGCYFCLLFWADALSADGQNEFFSEAKLMKEIGTHANIVGLIFDGYLEGGRALEFTMTTAS